MAQTDIVPYTNRRIRRKGEALPKSTDVAVLVEQMRKAMKIHDGIGIAAPQIGEAVRVFIIEKKLFPGADLPSDVFINPKILRKGFKREISEEGCLSVPNVFGQVSRSLKITIEAFDQNWKRFRLSTQELLARVLQHELDHLDGTLFIDKADADTLHEVVYDKEGKPTLRPWTQKSKIQNPNDKTNSNF
ncbi:MAG: peptide deformylase [Candidatus Terrybacteria bacterium RIFCSPHIGHO2_01_FULL_48_17]|uniref:Peptide deformylase n=1 Tax=Candidatus Terrybacteria bacterium RIFCSPHIGHO2_01_FULL_48_17 TaxID=1802362 RepID=A0A1G2PKK6_9BACT|nr:MAG: peptide deformylase [Candidatus Terrybacteria bacterium RIFCSPHIGHO2_01_FULL_48_17]OHA52929.1 MAG: peptide deformylase [Candidatus Terrybacteria bacterium RIFCSPLOWO2_01_FULL_48_14]